ncbi:DEAD/DEAH box helicase family protein [Tritonibacter scottomollicae]|uniref:DEAD/DEAH box helicase family protein n=2 Tax=Tritonibacter scottomollicae TaxID=483013 RepID=A0ABZ0HDY7_TRISK|nr:DEAD/DEAH box helicase family protein [Tritonibacter scottomollicae]
MEAQTKPVRFELVDPLFYRYEKTKSGLLTQLALGSSDLVFAAVDKGDNTYDLESPSGVKFSASARKLKGKSKGKFQIIGDVRRTDISPTAVYDSFKINGENKDGERLRPAQVGALYALLSHWSLSQEVATVVLPTGTGKTETMLAASIADQAKRTLVVVPSIELKDQISEKFANWGILRKLGVIADHALNPSVFVMQKTLGSNEDLNLIQSADVVIATPGLLARAKKSLLEDAYEMFSHVFFDEAHHVKAAEWSFLKERFKHSKTVQFTATPYRTDRQPIEGKVVYNYPLSRALSDECFSKISLVSVSERHPKKKDRAIADAAMRRLSEDRKKGWRRHRMMVRAGGKNEAERLFGLYSEWFPDERIVLVHSGTKGRKSIIADIKAGKYDIIVCVDMLKEGFDFPDLKIAAVHSVHKSLSVLLQFIGRFTRTQNGLGDASFVVNFADERMSTDLEDLFQEGNGWEKVISEISDAKKADAESLLAFLQGCEPYSGFDAPDIELHPKIVYPALSCVCFHADNADWSKFTEAFDLKKYAISHPYFNKDENVFYFATQKREKVKWARSRKMSDQKWDLVVLHYDASTKLLYVGFSDKKLGILELVEAVTGTAPRIINGDDVFRSFDDIKRLSIVHAGIFKPANHLHRYSRLSGADVTTELSRWKEGKRCKKSDFVGVGFRGGFPVSIGASVKGKVWSPARAGDLKDWKKWCLEIGRMLTDETINSNQLLENSAERVQIAKYPDDLIVLATDWSEQLYDRMHKLILERPERTSFMLSECSLVYLGSSGDTANFNLLVMEDTYPFSIKLGGEQGHSVHGLEEVQATIEGLKSQPMGLTQFFAENPPTLFLLNSCTISGSIHTDYGEMFEVQIPNDRIRVFDWDGVDLTTESMFKGGTARPNSIQEYIMKYLVKRGARVVFNDDNSGESADIVAVFEERDKIRFELVHCKYSKETVGNRKSDLYEVCGQAIVSLRYKWKPEELLRHMQRRNGAGVLKGKRFYHGADRDIEDVAKALKFSEVEFEFAIAQPGVGGTTMSLDQKNLLGSIYSTIIEMTETKLLCYFNEAR